MFSDAVKAQVEEILKNCADVDLMDEQVLLANLVFILQVIKASENLLDEAIAVEPKTPFDWEIFGYYSSHVNEERGHYEWLKKDLEDFNVDLYSYPLMRKAVEMAGTQYYMLKHEHQAALLGYMAVLEGFPVPLEQLEKLEERHGKDVLKTLRYHSEHDLEHRKELFMVINSVPEELQNLVMQSAAQTAVYIVEATHQWLKT